MHFVGLNAIIPVCSKKDITAEQLLTKVSGIHMEMKTSERAESVNILTCWNIKQKLHDEHLALIT